MDPSNSAPELFGKVPDFAASKQTESHASSIKEVLVVSYPASKLYASF